MRRDVLLLLAKQVFTDASKNRAITILVSILAVLFIYAAYSGLTMYQQQTSSRLYYQKQVRENWENMPDKHPHRMAHYGYIAFRAKHPLSFFDFGMESYTGNAVFLEAHRQNTINFSEAGFSTGMLRFGEISMAMILQVLLPLVIFFIGFNLVAFDRENGTLKILLSQGTSWNEIIFGKTLGLLTVALSVFLPVVIATTVAYLVIYNSFTGDDVLRILWITIAYMLYFGIISVIAVIISSITKTAKVALVSLIGTWLLFTIILPRTTQALGNYLYPSPSKIEFETAIDEELLKKGDSHNPNDPFYKALKDSIFKVYKVTSVEQLPFNYAGFQMKEGERISSEIYNKHLFKLLDTYQQQNSVARLTAFLNPYIGLRNLSMALSGTDFYSYTRFQKQAEVFRYCLAQHMNDLQIKLISSKKLGAADKPYSISKDHWKAFPDFKYEQLSQRMVIENELLSITSLFFWIGLLSVVTGILTKTLKAI